MSCSLSLLMFFKVCAYFAACDHIYAMCLKIDSIPCGILLLCHTVSCNSVQEVKALQLFSSLSLSFAGINLGLFILDAIKV